MKNKSARLAAASLATLAIGGALPQAAQAQEGPWRFQAAIYGWFPALSGTSEYPAQTGGTNIDVSMGDVIDALKFTFQGNFEARKGKWGLWTDVVYADFGASKSASRDFTLGGNDLPVGVNANLQLDMKSWIWTFAGEYNLVETPEYTSDVLFGTRYIDLSNRLGWSFNTDIEGLPGRTGSANADLKNWDAIVGFKGRANFGDERRWFVPYYVDIGAGESKFTWQVYAGLGYKFDWGAIVASWRYLDYEFKSSAKVQSLSFNGPLIGVVFQW